MVIDMEASARRRKICKLLLAASCHALLCASGALGSSKSRIAWLNGVKELIKQHDEDIFIRNSPTTATQYKNPAVGFETLIMTKDRPRLSHHASTIIELQDGGLLSSWFAGTYEGENDVGIWISRFDQRNNSWSYPEEVVAPRDKEPCWNPVLFHHEASKEVILFYKIGPSPSSWRGYLKRSTDQGRTWGLEEALPFPVIGPSKNKPLELVDGTIVVGTSLETGKKWSVWVERSKDGGRSWERIGPLKNTSNAMIQPTVFQDSEGGLSMVLRTRMKRMAIAHGDPSGHRWSSVHLVEDIRTPNSGLDAVKLLDGRLLLVYNRSRRQGSAGRNSLDVAISENSGENWKHVLNLENAKADTPMEFSYPAVIQGSNGDIHITYTWGRYNIKYVRLQPQFLRNGQRIQNDAQ